MRSSRMTQSLPEYQHHTDTDANMPMRPKPRETQGVLGDIFALANPLSPTVVCRRHRPVGAASMPPFWPATESTLNET